MAKQARVRVQAAGGRRDVGTTPGGLPGHDLGEAYADLLTGWTAFYQDMGSRLSDNLTRQQKAYDELLDKWNEFSGSARKIVENPELDASQRELYDVWRNYANKIGSRMTRASTEGLKGYGEMTSSLERYANRMGEIARQVSTGKVETVKAEEIYDTWLDISARLRQQMDRAADMSREEMEELSRTWLEFSSKMEAFSSGQLEKEGPYAEFVALWSKQSKDVNEALGAFIRGHDHHHEETRKAWTEHYMKMQESMADLARSIGSSSEGMYRRFLEGGYTSLSDLPMFPMWWTKREAKKD